MDFIKYTNLYIWIITLISNYYKTISNHDRSIFKRLKFKKLKTFENYVLLEK